MLARMQQGQKERVGGAIAEAMEHAGMSSQELADLAEVRIETIRDILAGRTYPRQKTRNRIEEALSWDTGRIARIASDEPLGGPSGLAARAPTVEEQMEALLKRTELTRANQYRLMATYHELLEQQRKEHNETRRRAIAAG